jgi:hypothetical protein
MIDLQRNKISTPEVPVDTQATLQYLALYWQDYQEVAKSGKSQIIDNVSRTLGILRDSASRLLRSKHPPRSLWGRCSPRRAIYSPECQHFLEPIWVGSGYMSSPHLAAALPTWLPHFEREGLTENIREQLLGMSASTIERLLKQKKAEVRRRNNTGTRRGVRKIITQIPIKPLGHRPTEPGELEADLVAHCGESMSGIFAWTLTVTDLATGTTECEAVWGKSGRAVCQALLEIEKRLPFRIISISFDNGTEFLNDDVLQDFIKKPLRPHIITAYRSRPYKKNDQCYVEQKNNTHVREYFGYGRLDWKGSVALMNAVYRGKWRILQNHFRPQQKLQSKVRVFSKVFRKMDKPETPLARLQQFLSTDVYDALVEQASGTNPFDLTRDVRSAIRNIYGYYKGIQRTEKLWGRKVS